MKTKSLGPLLALLFFCGALHLDAAESKSSGVPVTLRNGVHGMVLNGRLMLARENGKFSPAASGRYIAQSGKAFAVQSGGRIDPKAAAELTTPTANDTTHAGIQDSRRRAIGPTGQVKSKPAAPSASWGNRRQTGSNL